MSMSKKDYQAIARAVYRATQEDAINWDEGTSNLGIVSVVRELADVFAADSPHFDRARFLEWCETGTDRESAKRARKASKVPQCARDMGCLCAAHARGAAPSALCDATE